MEQTAWGVVGSALTMALGGIVWALKKSMSQNDRQAATEQCSAHIEIAQRLSTVETNISWIRDEHGHKLDQILDRVNKLGD